MIITLTGNSSLQLARRLNELTDKFVSQYGTLALERLDASEAEASAILEAVQSSSFLSPKKMVIVRELGTTNSAAEQIEQIISSVLTDTDLVIYEPKPDKRTAYYKTLKAKTHLEEFTEIDAKDLPAWIVEEASSLGSKISLADARLLVDRVGTNQAILQNELEKVALYNSPIAKADIELLVDKAPQSKIFDLLDASFADNKTRALKLYEEQRAQQVEPQAILALITWQLNLIALAKAGRGKPAGVIARDAGVNPYPLNKAQNLAAKVSDDKLRHMVRSAFEIDYDAKTYSLDLDEALQAFIATI